MVFSMIQFNKPFLPPREEFEKYLEGIWQMVWLINKEPLVVELERKLEHYVSIEYQCYVTNGTIALQISILAIGLNREIITTPYSYMATTSSIVWEGCVPIFVDIDPGTLNMDPEIIDEAISPETSGIIATHLFGNTCNIEAIAGIADKHNLKIIYDVAHGFGSTYKGRSIYTHGDIWTASFHATKLLQTVEGGAIVTKEKKVVDQVDFVRNFGHDGPVQFNGVGIKGKGSEFHAAMGLCNLKYVDKILSVRSSQSIVFDALLEHLPVRKPDVLQKAGSNFSSYPVIFETEEQLIEVFHSLETLNIHPRRYFFPTLNQLDYVSKQNTPVAEDIASRILCLPLYHKLKEEGQQLIMNIISQTLT